jgi:hypothetical protein
MRTLGRLAVVATAVVLLPVAAEAQERVTDAAFGAIAGAVAAGPIGFVGGGIIGYAAGPQIACDLGVQRCHRHVRYRHPRNYSHADRPDIDSHADRGDIGKRPDHGNY